MEQLNFPTMPRPMVGVYTCQAYNGNGELHEFEIRARNMFDADSHARDWCHKKKWHFDAINHIRMKNCEKSY